MPATYEPIATQSLSSAAASIVFSSIPSTYTDLRIVLRLFQISQSSAFFQFNGDTGTNYSRTRMYGDRSGTTGTQSVTGSTLGVLIQPGSTTANTPSFGILDIFSYASSNWKTALSQSFVDFNGAIGGANETVQSAVNLWRSTSAITSITLSPSSGNFAISTSATLYGIQAA
jgi:hypothetical protein